MKIVGGHYLKVTLKPILDEVQNISPTVIVCDLMIVALLSSDLLMGRVHSFMCSSKNKTEHFRSKLFTSPSMDFYSKGTV